MFRYWQPQKGTSTESHPIGAQSPTIDRLAEIATLDKVGLAITISTEAKDTGKVDSQRDFLNEDCFALAKNEDLRLYLDVCLNKVHKNRTGYPQHPCTQKPHDTIGMFISVSA